MIAFNWISLCSSFISLALGIWVYSFNKKAILNKLFLLTSLAAFAYSFTTVMMWMSNSAATAFLWNKIGTIWPFFAALVLNFALVFTGSKWLKNKLNYLILYFPAILFCLVN